jgi:phosphoglycerate dehydrogenase-like enzyme
VFMSPHCADRTKEFQLESMEVFVENMPRYIAGDQLVNVVDKARG